MQNNKKPLKIALIGASGRMGKAITELAPEKGFVISAAIGPDTDRQCLVKMLEQSDLAIEFTNAPEMTCKNARLCAETKKPFITGTTGHTPAEAAELKQISETIPVILTSNTSIGINLVNELVKKAVQALDDSFDIEIIETHHRNKLDAPSGTALSILETINNVKKENQKNVFSRHGKTPRQKGEIGIHAVRGGLITGEHQIRFAGDFEEISISHRAFDRKVFALGALKAASFIANQNKPGFYSMKDVLNG